MTYEYVSDEEQEIFLFQVDFLTQTNKTTEANFAYLTKLDLGFSCPNEAF